MTNSLCLEISSLCNILKFNHFPMCVHFDNHFLHQPKEKKWSPFAIVFFQKIWLQTELRSYLGLFSRFFSWKKFLCALPSFVILFNSQFLRIMKLVLLSFKYQVRHISIELRKTVWKFIFALWLIDCGVKRVGQAIEEGEVATTVG